jgi:hypothetical protein
MASRLELHEEFETILGTNDVYFDPPASVQMNYPCIRYKLDAPSQLRANNRVYRSTNRYKVTVIDEDPESEIPSKIQDRFEMCSIDQTYTADNLNHTVLTLYY